MTRIFFLGLWSCSSVVVADVYQFNFDAVELQAAEQLRVYDNERGLADSLIYQGRGSVITVVMATKQPLWVSRCKNDDCKKPVSIQPQEQSTAERPKPLSLAKTVRSRSARRLGKRVQPPNARLVGAVLFAESALMPCVGSPPAFGETVSFPVPGLGLIKVHQKRVLNNLDGSWTWIGLNQPKNVTAVFQGRACDDRPYGSLRTSKGMYWVRPLKGVESHGVYKMKL